MLDKINNFLEWLFLKEHARGKRPWYGPYLGWLKFIGIICLIMILSVLIS